MLIFRDFGNSAGAALTMNATHTQKDAEILACVENLESYAGLLDSLDATARTRLLRIIRALARIAHRRRPFSRMPLRYQDEGGHSDNSFPPDQVYADKTGPRLLEVIGEDTENLATSSGFYYSWRQVTKDTGLYVSSTGELHGCNCEGTGSLGQFAAHPGDHDVSIDLDYPRHDTAEVPLDRLRKAITTLVELAFPTVAKSPAALALSQ